MTDVSVIETTTTVSTLANSTVLVEAIETGAVESVSLHLASPTDDSWSGITTSLTAGETLAQNNVVYVKSDGKVWKADADTVATAPVVGLATAAITANVSGTILLNGLMRDDSGFAWTVGGTLYLSNTAGAITQTAPSGANNVIQVLGYAVTADIIYFNPQLVLVEHA